HTKKQIQRFAEGVFYLAIVEDKDITQELHREDHEDFQHIWLDGNELMAQMDKQVENEHWTYGVKRAITKNIELGYDKTSDSNLASTSPVTENGRLFNSAEYSGLTSEEATAKMQTWLEENNLGKKVTNYKLRDWLVS